MRREWYIIANIENLVNAARVLVFNSFGSDTKQQEESLEYDINYLDIDSLSDEDRDELNSVLSYDESYSIVMENTKKQTNKKTKKIRYLMNDLMFAAIIDNLNSRMISNMLNNLVNKGVLETGFDNDTNEFVFWIKDHENKKPDQSETD